MLVSMVAFLLNNIKVHKIGNLHHVGLGRYPILQIVEGVHAARAILAHEDTPVRGEESEVVCCLAPPVPVQVVPAVQC